MIWYRGSSGSHLEFKTDGNGNRQHGPGLYFTNNPETAKIYGAVQSFDIDGKLLTEDVSVSKHIISKMLNLVPKDVLEIALQNWDEDPTKAKNMLLDSLMNQENMIEALQSFWVDGCNGDSKIYKTICKKVGIDGIIIEKLGEKWLVVYNTDIINPIKSALLNRAILFKASTNIF